MAQPDLERMFACSGAIITSRILCDNITGKSTNFYHGKQSAKSLRGAQGCLLIYIYEYTEYNEYHCLVGIVKRPGMQLTYNVKISFHT